MQEFRLMFVSILLILLLFVLGRNAFVGLVMKMEQFEYEGFYDADEIQIVWLSNFINHYHHNTKMSNPARYSPYNKTYKFLLFQNQAYHQKNKLNAKPCVRTNLRYRKSSSFNQDIIHQSNPQTNIQKQSSSQILYQSSQKQNDTKQMGYTSRSAFFNRKSVNQLDVCIDKPKKIIHKHLSYEMFKNMRVQRQNRKMVGRILSTSCEVIKKKNTQNHFQNHLRYRQIRNKYDQKGSRKHALVVGDHQLLCPTLKQYNESGLAQKFVEGHLSWARSSTSKGSYSIRRSQFSCS